MMTRQSYSHLWDVSHSFMLTFIQLMFSYEVILIVLKVFLAKETGTQQVLAIKALKKTFVLNHNVVTETFVEKRILSLGSSFPYLPTLHSTFASPVSCSSL